MNATPTIVVRKSGFLSAIAYGLFGFLATCVICAATVTVVALNIADKQAGWVAQTAGELVGGLPQWLDKLPPVLSDALSDRHAPEYATQVRSDVRIIERRGSMRYAVIEVTNHGSETISLLVLNVLLEDENGDPITNLKAYAATPLAINNDGWQGCLPPGQTRKFSQRIRSSETPASATIAPIDVRILTRPTPPTSLPATSTTTDLARR